MIRPDIWRIWKPRYEKESIKRLMRPGCLTLLHSCSYIMDILEDPDRNEPGCDQIDQQENMIKDPGEESLADA